MTRRILPVLIILFALSAQLQAQHTVSGIVSDKADVTLLHEGVTIYIPELNKSDVSKEGGTYILTNVGIGTVHIRFSKEGYQTEVRTISTSDSAVVVNVELVKSILSPDITSQTSYHGQLPENTILPVNVYSSKELTKHGSIDILSSLAYNPESEVISDGPGNTHVSIHGSGINRVAYFEEGTKLENNFWDNYYSPGINFNGIENIEVVTGPATSVLGAGSFGAILLHDERTPVTGKKTGDVKIRFNSNTLGLDGQAGFKGSSAKGLFYSLRFGVQSQTSYIQGGDSIKVVNTEERPFASNSKFNASDVKATIGLNKKWGMSKITLSSLTQKNGLISIPEEAQNLADGIEREREISIPYQELQNNLFRSNTTLFAKRSLFAIDLSYQSNQNKTYSNNFENVMENTDGLDLSAFNYNVRYTSNPLKKYSFSLGTNGSSKEVKNKGTFSRIPDSKEMNQGGYVNLNYKWKRFLIQGAAQVVMKDLELETYKGMNDTSSSRPAINFKDDYMSINSSGSISYQPLKFLSFRIGASSGTETPNYLQLANYSLHERMNRFEIGNLKLKQESNLQFDLRVKVEFPAIAVEVNGFSNMINDYIFAFDSGIDTILPVDSNRVDTFNVFRYDQSDATINGLEMRVTINPPTAKWIKLQLSYSRIEGKFKGAGYLPDIPADKLTAALTLKSEKMNYLYKPFLTFAARNYSERVNIAFSEKSNESYFLLDFHLGGSFRWGNQFFDISVSANNILNTNFYNQYSLLRNLGTSGVSDMGRNVSVQLHIPFGLGK
ncbi:MAG: TonB-dependent receptor [Bacteroidota bacterium]